MEIARETVDEMAVNRFCVAMKNRMAVARSKGRNYWEQKDLCSTEVLADGLLKNVVSGDFLDVAVYAMMLYERGESPEVMKTQIERLFGVNLT